MKKIGGLLFLCLLHFGCYSQNLVPNGSFETFSICPISNGQIYLATPWTDPSTGSSDYFNVCSTNFQSSVPTSLSGHRYARTGNAYAGIITYVNTNVNSREYIEVKLNDSLIQNRTYCLGFYVSLGEAFEYASNGLSAFFSPVPVNCSGCFMPYTPQINYLGPPITDTLNWVLIQGVFVANGGERYLILGNFNSDLNTNISLVNPGGSGGPAAYYYIDDVNLTSCDTTRPPPSSLVIPNIFTPNNDGQNDVFQIRETRIQTLDCSIYDRWGIKIWELHHPGETWDGRNKTGMPCADGVYYYVLSASGEDGKAYNLSGLLELIR